MDYCSVAPGLYHGGACDAGIAALPMPLGIITMNVGEVDEGLINHGMGIDFVLSVWIEDRPDAVLSDSAYLALLDTCLALKKSGYNLYVHCAAGISRSSYLTLGILMATQNINYSMALMTLRKKRAFVMPNAGFEAHLKKLESQIRSRNNGTVPNPNP